MVKLILHDFQSFIDHDRYENDSYSLDDLYKLLQNVWKIKSKEFLIEYEKAFEFIKTFKKNNYRKLPHYYTIPHELVDNEMVVWELLKYIREEYTFNQISQRLRDKFRIAIRAVSQFGYLYKFLNDELKKNRTIALEAVKSCANSYGMLSDELKNDREIVMRALKGRLKINIPKEFIADKSVVMSGLKTHRLCSLYGSIPHEMLDDREFAIAAVLVSPSNIGYLSDRLQNDLSFAKQAIRKSYYSYSEFPKVIRENRDFVKQMVNMNLPLFLIPHQFRSDEEIVTIRLLKNFSEINYANHSILTKEFFMNFLKQTLIPSFDFFTLVPDYIATDSDIIMSVLAKSDYSYRYLKEQQKTREVTEYLLSVERISCYCILPDLPAELRKDRELVKRCIEKATYIGEIPAIYREDEEIFKMALRTGVKSFKDGLVIAGFIAPKYLNDDRYMMELIKEIPELATNKYYKPFQK